jgi:hypothetical protein
MGQDVLWTAEDGRGDQTGFDRINQRKVAIRERDQPAVSTALWMR